MLPKSERTWDTGLWVTGSIPIFISFFLSFVFQWFFTSLSVLPGSRLAIKDHLHHKKWKKRVYGWRVCDACQI